MSDHIEHACGKCGSYLHHEDRCGEERVVGTSPLRLNLCEPPREHDGYRFTCASKCDNATTFPCTGSVERDDFPRAVCTCECHVAKPMVLDGIVVSTVAMEEREDGTLPPELLRALRNPDVEVPGEEQAVANVMRWAGISADGTVRGDADTIRKALEHSPLYLAATHALAHLESALAAAERRAADLNRCSTCGGDPASHPSGLPCVCGDGTREGEVRGLRQAAIAAERRAAEAEAGAAAMRNALEQLHLIDGKISDCDEMGCATNTKVGDLCDYCATVTGALASDAGASYVPRADLDAEHVARERAERERDEARVREGRLLERVVEVCDERDAAERRAAEAEREALKFATAQGAAAGLRDAVLAERAACERAERERDDARAVLDAERDTAVAERDRFDRRLLAATDALRDVTAERDDLHARVDEIAEWVAGIQAHARCAFCAPQPSLDGEAIAKLMEHMRACGRHPLAEALRERDAAVARAEGMAGATPAGSGEQGGDRG